MASKTPKRDYYEILGINKNASLKDIKSAFVKLAKIYHPDNTDTGNEARFREINTACEVLSDPQKRKLYDQFGHQGIDQGGGNSAGFSDFSGFSGGFQDLGSVFGDLFGDLFGGNRRSQQNQRYAQGKTPISGENILTKVEIDFKDVFFGKTMTISINIEVVCEICKGTGAKSASDIFTCDKCKGKGIVEYVQQSPLGIFSSKGICNQCQGLGKIIRQKCLKCKGHTYYIENQKLEFDIPRSIVEGQQIRIKGKGKVGRNGGSQGDLFISIMIKPHPLLERRGNDIYIKLLVSYLDVILGNVIMIPTFEGIIKEKLPSGMQHGDKIILKNKGFYHSHSHKRGDLHVILDVKFPNKVTKSEQEKLWNINNETNFNPNEDFANSSIKRI